MSGMSAHSVARLLVHFVWTTKYRLPTIEVSDDARLHRLLDDAAASVGCQLIAVGNAGDHVHALVRVSAKVTIAALVTLFAKVTRPLADKSPELVCVAAWSLAAIASIFGRDWLALAPCALGIAIQLATVRRTHATATHVGPYR